ncbi:endo-1,3(4)-beta-glucanase 1 [Sander lucioperca]|uniref:endo-1,3(4)-beta-glucanase 1 n=1 Tax=Sander lucioperca TaxID=283035 RepID=UPI001653C589|nr:endo-1,3(4)-beta-glucanase 1 [Sander lucioperca]
MASLQAGQRSFSLSANVIMASTTFIKDTGCTGILRLLLLGLLLPSVLVSGQTTLMPSTAAPTDTTSGATATTNSTQPLTTAGSTATAPSIQPATTNSGSTIMQPSISTTTGPTTNSTTVGSSTTFGGKPSASSTVGSTAMKQSSTAMATGGTSSSSSMTSNSGSMTSSMSTMSSMSSDSTGRTNGTTMIHCPSFICNYSDCYTMYTSQNATHCTAGFCQLIRRMDMLYTVSCSASCAASCVNTSQTNCSISCCNSTGCLNSSFASMMMMTTTVIATTTTTPTPTTTTTATSPQTTANNGNKCHRGVCTGTDCYTKFKEVQICSTSEPHCQLKKETKDSSFQWTAGCTNCSGQTPCKTSTVPPCLLECCNATTSASCLVLNGTLNVPNFATRGPHLHKELIASLVCLLAITLLL